MYVGVDAYPGLPGLLRLDNLVSDAEAMFEKTHKCVNCRAAVVRNPSDPETILKHLRHDFLEPLAALPKEQMPDAVMLVWGDMVGSMAAMSS